MGTGNCVACAWNERGMSVDGNVVSVVPTWHTCTPDTPFDGPDSSVETQAKVMEEQEESQRRKCMSRIGKDS